MSFYNFYQCFSRVVIKTDSCILMMVLHVLFLSICLVFNVVVVEHTKVVKVGIKGSKG